VTAAHSSLLTSEGLTLLYFTSMTALAIYFYCNPTYSKTNVTH